jgi:hypothetical protein
MTQKAIRPSAEALANARALLDDVRPTPRTPSKKFIATQLPTGLTPTFDVTYRPFFLNGSARYVEVYVPTHPASAARCGWVFAHRIVAENGLGRYLRKGESVRFKDGNGFNYAPQNLVVYGGEAEA